MEDIKRLPPCSREAELSVLGSIIIDNDCIVSAAATIRPSYFYYPEHKIMYETMVNLHNKAQAIDVVTIMESLTATGLNEKIGGYELISTIVQTVPTSVNVKEYAMIVKKHAYMRASITHCNKIIGSAYTMDYDDVQSLMSSMPSISLARKPHKTTKEILQEYVLDDVKRRTEAESDSIGLPTGFKEIDDITGGLKGGELIGMKAGPNIGKSVLALEICKYTASRGLTAAFFAYEMTTQSLGYRLAPDIFRVPIDHLNNPKNEMDNYDIASIKRAIKDIDTNNSVNYLHIFANELEENTVEELEGHVKLLGDVKLITVDYLQLLEGDKTSFGMDKYTENLRKLKRIAKRYDIPIIVILSETKTGEIRGTNEVEHDLDQLIELRREKFATTPEGRSLTEVLIKKGRNNKLGKGLIKFDENYIKFK